MARRSKEYGRPVAELTAGEMAREAARCRAALQRRQHPEAVKWLRQRLRQIEARRRREGEGGQVSRG